MDDIRAVLPSDYRTLVADFGPQAGALAHIVQSGSEAALCGVPRAMLGSYEDVDEPVCAKCLSWYSKMATGRETA